ncbi:MAG: YfhO family protein [Chlamydiae bacterium]|nr:YfhO family protein [Chlamydiota bacterium]MBI3266395.1 YfhO family protein [Chlamydiota bacterium]
MTKANSGPSSFKSFLSDSFYVLTLFFLPFIRYGKMMASCLAGPLFSTADMSGIHSNQLFFFENLKRGILSLWNSHVSSGFPIFGDIQNALFYPLQGLFFLLMKQGVLKLHAMQMMEIFHYSLAGIFSYVCARSFKWSRFASFVTGLSYMFSGFLWAHGAQANTVEAAAWLPLIFMCMHQAFEKKSFGHALACGFAWALSFLAGDSQGTFCVFFFLGLYFIFQCVWEIGDRGFSMRILSYPFLFGLVGLTFMGVAAIQLLPSLEWARRASPLSLPFSNLTALSLKPRYFLSFLIPFFVPDGEIGLKEGYVYLGLLPPYFAFASLLYVKKERKILFLALMALLSFFLSMGSDSFIHFLFYRFIPGSSFFSPPRFIFLFSFCAALLAGCGIEFLIREKGRLPFLSLLLGGLGISLGVGFWIQISGGPLSRGDLLDRYYLFLLVLALSCLALKVFEKGKSSRGSLFFLTFILLFDLLSATSSFQKTESTLSCPISNSHDFLQGSRGLFRVKDEIGLWKPLRDEQAPLMDRVEGNEESSARLDLYSRFLAKTVENARLLDFLNTRFWVTSDEPMNESWSKKYRRVKLSRIHSRKELEIHWPREKDVINSIQLVSCLENAQDIRQGTTVAQLQIVDHKGKFYTFPIRAGLEASEGMYDRPDIFLKIKHHRTLIASSSNVEGETYQAHQYLAHFDLPKPIRPVRAVFHYLVAEGDWMVQSVTLNDVNIFDSKDRFKKVAPQVFENQYVLPRAFLVPRAEVIPSKEDIEKELCDLEPSETVLLSKAPPGYVPLPLISENSKKTEVEIKKYSPEEILLETDCLRQVFLVISENFYPGWKAEVDGQKAEIYQANLSFRALLLEKGKHTIRMVFHPASFKWGLRLSLGSLSFLGLYAIFSLLMKRRWASHLKSES